MFHVFSQDDTYGPGTDLAMALLGIFILSSAISKKTDASINNRLNIIAENQITIVNALANSYMTVPEYSTLDGDSVYFIPVSTVNNNKISIKNSEITQLFSFGDNLLFEVGKAELKDQGEEVIGNIGKIIKENIQYIEEIQIQGHADTIPTNIFTDVYKSNIELASARATTVFESLKEKSGIDPSSNLMSIVSYGEFKPVERKNSQIKWDRTMLNEANNTEQKRSKNRRIEIVLIYK